MAEKKSTAADTDVSLDFLTKEAKEALLSKKLDMIRQQNKALTERHQLIEADRKKAEESGQAVKLAIDSKLCPAEGALKPRGRGRGHTNHKDARNGREHPQSSGDFRDSSNYEPIVDTTDLLNHRYEPKGKGRGSHPYNAQSSTPKSNRKPSSKDDALTTPSGPFEYEPIVDIRDLEKRFGLISGHRTTSHPYDRDTRTPSYRGRSDNRFYGNDMRPYANNRGSKSKFDKESPAYPRNERFENKNRESQSKFDEESPANPRNERRSENNNRESKSKFDEEFPAYPRNEMRLENKNRETDVIRNNNFYDDRDSSDSKSDKEAPVQSRREKRPNRKYYNDKYPSSNTTREQESVASPPIESDNLYGGRLKDNEGPPPDPSFNPLADRRRIDKKDEHEYRRHPRNYGGNADLTRVKQSMKTQREKEKERPASNKPIEIVMTGKERRCHEEWKAERERYDQERIQRAMNSVGSWKRAWDVDKVNQESEDPSSPTNRLEPGKRPAGRIGSGRFDRGERDERPRSAIIGKGAVVQIESSPSQSPRLQESTLGVEGKRNWAKGRGRGRGRGSVEKSSRPRTWSGGDDRFVECQKELLLVKFDNTAGDNSVEVQYDDVDLSPPVPSTPPVKSTPLAAPSTPSAKSTPLAAKAKSPTGCASNSKQHQQQTHKPHKGHVIDKRTSSKQTSSHQGEQDSPDKNKTQVPSVSPLERTSSHSQSFGDSEEWEDCTESSGALEEPELKRSKTPDLHLMCTLNPDAPEFLPTSPDFLKTPPGHVKVLNWSSELASPPPKTSPSRLSEVPSADSSAHLQEEEDAMPESDEPFDPNHITLDSKTYEDEEEDHFEDSLESAHDNKEILGKVHISDESTNVAKDLSKETSLTTEVTTTEGEHKYPQGTNNITTEPVTTELHCNKTVTSTEEHECLHGEETAVSSEENSECPNSDVVTATEEKPENMQETSSVVVIEENCECSLTTDNVTAGEGLECHSSDILSCPSDEELNSTNDETEACDISKADSIQPGRAQETVEESSQSTLASSSVSQSVEDIRADTSETTPAMSTAE